MLFCYSKAIHISLQQRKQCCFLVFQVHLPIFPDEKDLKTQLYTHITEIFTAAAERTQHYHLLDFEFMHPFGLNWQPLHLKMIHILPTNLLAECRSFCFQQHLGGGNPCKSNKDISQTPTDSVPFREESFGIFRIAKGGSERSSSLTNQIIWVP